MNNLDKQYQALLKDILSYGVDKNDRTGTGTKSIFGYTIYHNMQNGFPLLTTKKVAFKTMATELMWFLMGDTNIKYLVDNGVHIWDGDAYKKYHQAFPETEMMSKEDFIETLRVNDEFAEKWGDLGPIYGKQWRKWVNTSKGWKQDSWFTREIDQISNLINELKANPDSRRLMVSAWDVGSIDLMTLPPCHYGFQVYTRELTWEEQVKWVMKNTNVEWENLYIVEEIAKPSTPKRAISLSWNQRSVDVFLGLPFNIASYGLLLEMIAREVNMVPENLIGHLGDTHLYLDHLDQAQQQLERIPRDLPIMKMSSGHNFRAALKGNADEIDLDDFMLVGYNPHPTIKAPLSN
jgi:thymidylate synthase